jgi:hypothetical protein
MKRQRKLSITTPKKRSRKSTRSAAADFAEISQRRGEEFRAAAAAAGSTIEFLKRVRAAQKRINRDPLRWIAEWSRREDPCATDAAGIEMLAFVVRNKSFNPDAPRKIERLTPDQLSDCRRQVREGIAGCLAGRPWRIPPSSVTRELVREGDRAQVEYVGDAIDCFPAAAFDLIATEVGRLRRCRWSVCGHAFVRRRRQLFCSSRCGDKAHFAQWRKNHGILIENRWVSLESDEVYREYRRREYEQKKHGTDRSGPIAQLKSLRAKS